MWMQEALFNNVALFQPIPSSDGFLRVTFPSLGYVLKPLHLRSQKNGSLLSLSFSKSIQKRK
jgi:hypothetical protein